MYRLYNTVLLAHSHYAYNNNNNKKIIFTHQGGEQFESIFVSIYREGGPASHVA